MKRILTFTLFAFFTILSLQAQTLDELKTKKADLEAQQAAEQAKADAFNGEIGDLAKKIEILSGWQKGLTGSVGLNFGRTSNWAANANRNSSSSILNLGINAFANNIKEKSFWRNTLITNISWQGLDNDTDDDQQGTGFLGDRNGDLLIGSSLYGFRLNQDIAISALGDLNTSIFSFLAPGTFDIGAGFTWTPHQVPDLVVIVHPLTLHFAFSAFDAVSSQSGVGAKVKATYTREFGKGIIWSSNLGAFLPYGSDAELTPMEANLLDLGTGVTSVGLFEYTWINSFNVADVWKGIGVGVTFGIRGADFESPDLQTYSAVGLTYGF